MQASQEAGPLISKAYNIKLLMNMRAEKPAVDVKPQSDSRHRGEFENPAFADAFQQRIKRLMLAESAAVCNLSK